MTGYKIQRKSTGTSADVRRPSEHPAYDKEGVGRLVAVQALRDLRGLLPSYRELCGTAPYYYAAGEVQRLEHQLIGVYTAADLAHMSETIRLQLEGMARAIRAAKGRGVELDG